MITTTARKTKSPAWRAAEAAFAAACASSLKAAKAEAAPPAASPASSCTAPGRRPILGLAKTRLN